MLLTIRQLSLRLNLSPQGTRKLLKRLNIQLASKNHKQVFDTSDDKNPLALSLRLQHQQSHLQVIYSIADIAKLHHKDKKTILSLLQESSVPLYGARKKFVYLWHLKQWQDKKQTGK